MKNMTKFKLKIIIIFNFMLGFVIILYTIYRRVFLQRLPKDLYFLDQNLDIRLFFMCIVIYCLFLHSFIFWNNLKILLKKYSSENFFKKLILKLNNILEKAFEEVYFQVSNLIPDIYNKLSKFLLKFYSIFGSKSEYIFPCILYAIRLIILVSFLLDIFVFFKFYYFYKIIKLLCIYVLINVFFYIMRDFVTNLEEIEKALIITDCGIDAESLLPIITYSCNKNYDNIDLEYYITQYILCNKLKGYLEMYDFYTNYITPRINCVIYFLYVVGWSYIFYINFTLFSF